MFPLWMSERKSQFVLHRNVVLHQCLDYNMMYRRVTAFLEQVIKNDCQCAFVALWETEATKAVGKAEVSRLLAQSTGTNVTSALERDKWMIHPKMNNRVWSEDKWANQIHTHWAIWLKELNKLQTNACVTILTCIGILEMNAWGKITVFLLYFTWLLCSSAEHNVNAKTSLNLIFRQLFCVL